jgi:hypothetical protein
MAATLTGGAIGAAGSAGAGVGALGGGQASGCKGGTTIPFAIQGTASDPKFIPDVSGVAAGWIKGQLGCAGGSVANVGKLGAGAPADSINTIGGLLGKRKSPEMFLPEITKLIRMPRVSLDSLETSQ